MASLYVKQAGAELRRKGSRLAVYWQRQLLTALPLRRLERLVLLAPVNITAATTQTLLKNAVPTFFCSSSGRYYGELSTGLDDTEMLMLQVARHQDQAFRLRLASALVSAKIQHQQRLLRRYARNHPDPELTTAANIIKNLPDTLTRREMVSQIMGVEGHASAVYFSAFGRCLRQPDVSFTERNRRPPKDPVNAALSLGYMLVLGEVLGALRVCGLHPGLGFLHEPSNRRPALALDLLELARQPVVDRLTLSLFNRRVLTPDDFEKYPSGEVRFREASLKRYLDFYERIMTTTFQYPNSDLRGTFRKWMNLHAEALRKALKEGLDWTPEPLEL